MKRLQLRISMMGLPNVYRTLAITGGLTFDDLHDEIIDAFNRADDNLYSFYLTRKHHDSTEKIKQAREIASPYGMSFDSDEEDARLDASEVPIGSIRLRQGDIIHYLLKLDGNWWHVLEVLTVEDVDLPRESCELVDKKGASPPLDKSILQAAIEDEDDLDDEEEQEEE